MYRVWTESELDDIKQRRENGEIWRNISKSYDVPEDVARWALKHRDKALMHEERSNDITCNRTQCDLHEGKEYEESGDTARVSISGLSEEVRSIGDLIRVCEIDPSNYEVTGYKQKSYQGFIKGKDRRPKKVQLYSVSATLKRKLVDARSELNELLKEITSVKQDFPLVDARGEYLASVNINDLHMGKYAWAQECGSDYDVDIAENLVNDAVSDTTAKLKPWNLSKIVVVCGSDLLNADNSEDTTHCGTPQTTDGRHTRTFRRTWMMMRRIISAFREIAPVHVVIVPGNHDKDSCFSVGEILSVAFESVDGVTIDNAPTLRKYVEYGKCLIGYTHGDGINAQRLAQIMPQEVPEAWGRTQWRVFETGHLHQQRVTEFPGVVVRVNPALCGPEDWHASKGFIGNVRTLHTHIWHKEDGNVAQISSKPVPHSAANVSNLASAYDA